ncbi:hypothetical protein MTO96_025066 [Rhipicephalus appendiculatus]
MVSAAGPADPSRHSNAPIQPQDTYSTTEVGVQQPCMAPYGHGNFQRRTLFFGIAALAALQCHSSAFVLITGRVDHWCKPPAAFLNLSDEEWKKIGIPVDAEGHHSRCFFYARPGVPAAANNTTTAEEVACTAWDYDQEKATSTARSLWNIVCHRRWLLVLGNTVYMSGALFVVPVAGHVADTVGRQPVITAAVLALVATTVGSCCTESYPAYLAASFANSACVSSVFVVTIILLFELTPLSYRALYISLLAFIGVVVTDAFIFVLTMLRLSWSLTRAVVLSPTFLLLPSLYVVSESPVWLLTHSKMQRAEVVMMRAAVINGVERGQALYYVRRLLDQLDKRRHCDTRISLSSVVTPGVVRTRAAIVFCTSFSIMLAFYVTSWVRIHHESPEMKVAFVCLSLPCYAVMYLAMSTFGRKQLLMCILPLLGSVCTVRSVMIEMGHPLLSDVLLIAARDCSIVAMQATYLCIAEIFPTAVRCGVMCAAYAFGRLGAIVSAVLETLRHSGRDDLIFVIIGFLTFASFLLVLWLPETSYGRNTMYDVQPNDDLSFLVQDPPEVREPMAAPPVAEENGRGMAKVHKGSASVLWLPETGYGRNTTCDVRRNDDVPFMVQQTPVEREAMFVPPEVEKNSRSTTRVHKNESASVLCLTEASYGRTTARDVKPNDDVSFLAHRTSVETEPMAAPQVAEENRWSTTKVMPPEVEKNSQSTTRVHENESASVLCLPEASYGRPTASDVKPNDDVSFLTHRTPVETEPMAAPQVAEKNRRSTTKVHKDGGATPDSSRKSSSRVTRIRTHSDNSRSRNESASVPCLPEASYGRTSAT